MVKNNKHTNISSNEPLTDIQQNFLPYILSYNNKNKYLGEIPCFIPILCLINTFLVFFLQLIYLTMIIHVFGNVFIYIYQSLSKYTRDPVGKPTSASVTPPIRLKTFTQGQIIIIHQDIINTSFIFNNFHIYNYQGEWTHF
jgi:hypothetical protein